MGKEIFRGVGTALVTPLRNDRLDVDSLGQLIERQIRAGVSALIIGGTTGEAATLTDGERERLYETARNLTRGRDIKLIFGTGSPDTRRAIEYTKMARELSADGVLVVTPYYNKGTREGIYRHYAAIAEAVDIPLILYNVPSRTGVNLDIGSVKRLAKIPNVVGLKEADGGAERYAELSTIKEHLPIYAGADSLIYQTLALGGAGVISVVSNLYPEATVELCKQFFANEREKALKIQHALGDVIKALFLDTNPAPIKYALSEKGLCTPEMRLPMWLPTAPCRRRIDKAVREYEEKRAKGV